jgi:hypothetical protein
MAVYPQIVHRFGARNPLVFHRFSGILYTVPAGLSTENQELSTIDRAFSRLSPVYPQDYPHEKPSPA